MPIPEFDRILNTLPPHTGDPRDATQLSPFPCTAEELCLQFATSDERKIILDGLLKLRQQLRAIGITGFHWIDGSFLEDIELLENRAPGDIDVVTFVANPTAGNDLNAAFANVPELLDRGHVKATYHVDHFLVPFCEPPEVLVELTRYWYGLFSHRRDQAWKGMLKIQFESADDDDRNAASVLGGATP